MKFFRRSSPAPVEPSPTANDARPAPRDKYWIDPEEDSLIPPRDLWIGPEDSITHYTRWVWEYLAYLLLVAQLEREEQVLELGCGHGRTARGLLAYLRAPGSYMGLDVNRARIEDAQRRFTARWSNFQFVWANVRNTQDNPDGANAATYRFPFPDASFDVIYAASLFTHLLPDEAANYLSEVRRVLRPDGRCLFSLFLLDYYRGPGTTISSTYEFEYEVTGHPGVAVRDADHAQAAVAYSTAAFEGLANRADLNIARVLPGLWSESPGWALNEQDLVLLKPSPR